MDKLEQTIAKPFTKMHSSPNRITEFSKAAMSQKFFEKKPYQKQD